MKTVTKKTIKKEVVEENLLPVKDVVKETAKETVKDKVSVVAKKSDKYFLGVGRRKTSTAQVRLYPQKKTEEQLIEMTVNGMDYKKYFPLKKLQEIVTSPIDLLHLQNRFKISCIVSGGGVPSSAGAIRLGISRALIEANPIFKKPLKRIGYLTRDARKKERKKPGLKKARRAPQWQKR